MKYFKAIAKSSSTGKNKIKEIIIYLKDKNKVSAIKQAKWYSGVKSNKLPEIYEITEEQYLKGLEKQINPKDMKSIEVKTM